MKNFIVKKNTHNRIILICLLLVSAVLISISNQSLVIANENIEMDVEVGVGNAVNDIIGNIDFAGLDGILDSLDSIELFDGNIKDKVLQILSGDFTIDFSNLTSSILSLFLSDIMEIVPLLFSIISIGILSSMFNEIKSENNSTSSIIELICIGVVTIILIYIFKDVLGVVSNTLSLILSQMQVVFPILLALLSSIGSLSSVSIYNPIVAILTTIVSIVFEKFLYPIFIVVFLFTILGQLSSSVKLGKLQGFLSTAFKYVVGLVLTIFTGFLSLQGITAGKFDSIGIKATKFAIKSYIPIIGSFISDGMDFLVLGSVLIKNSVGLVGVLVLFLTIISPVISLLIMKLGFQLTAGILEMTGAEKFSNYMSRCSSILVYPIVLILGVAFMYVITISLIICTANIF